MSSNIGTVSIMLVGFILTLSVDISCGMNESSQLEPSVNQEDSQESARKWAQQQTYTCPDVKARSFEEVKGMQRQFGIGTSRQARIIQGHDSDIASHPYMVSIQLNNSHSCGGAILNERQVLTAAHCTGQWDSFVYTLTSGSTHRYLGNQHNITSFSNHEKYGEDDNFFDYDISIMHVDPPFKFSRTVQPVRLVDENQQNWNWTAATVVGWGDTDEKSGKSPDTLLETEVHVYPQEECTRAYGADETSPRMLCAGPLPREQSHGTCLGDSGGPLLVDGEQVGIVSWAIGCSRPGCPTVYSNVAALRGWLKQFTG